MTEFASLIFEDPIRWPFWTVVGLLWGSFANVCIARMPVGESVVSGRSRCPRCARQIAWYDNIPVLSFLWLRAKCRHCALPISWQYPLVEIVTGILFPLSLANYGWDPHAMIYLPFVGALVVVTGIDIWHRIIPDQISIGGTLVGFALTVGVGYLRWPSSLLGAGVGFGLFFGFAWIYRRWKGIDGLGFGDVKFLAMLGAWLGIGSLLPIVVVASVGGSLMGVATMLRHKGGMQTAIPFGPFLVLGAFSYFFFQEFWGELLYVDLFASGFLGNFFGGRF